ncbi:glycerophosphodiester phosphodiesterase family protein [Pseudoclavibacter albus]|uniref:glycerophosphodiester phosphodiesterase family protein n=1 Tax=Pseudoclavibacter albus TaxID=272241 RepID=UPI0009F98B00|nr:glycerophosphodiester phosphodiesterase family protein [Pseudoclavibacter alba]
MLELGHGRPRLIGHRGAPYYRPEHSASGYRMALSQGCDAIEPDLVPSRDGVLVIRHGEALASSTDVADRPEFASRRRRKVVDGRELHDWFTEDFTWEELATLRCREPYPEQRPKSAAYDGKYPLMRLDHLMRLLEADRDERGTASLVIELKTPSAFAKEGYDLVGMLIRKLEEMGSSELLEGLIIESFDREALRELRWAMPLKLMPLFAGNADDEAALDEASLDDLTHWADGMSIATSTLGVRTRADLDGAAAGSALVAAAHERGLEVFTYTLRPEDNAMPPAFVGDPETYWRGLLATGVDGVFADAPDLVRPLLDDYATPERAALFASTQHAD